MSVWVRSQDKEFLMKVDNINLELNRLFTFVGGVTTAFTLGTYKSKERALEVLDEIQTWIERYEANKNNLFSGHFVYQMPKE